MAGHSKWHNIQHRKNAQDAKRGKVFTKMIKEIGVAVKVGGSDPESNPRLRSAIQNAKSANMSRDSWEKAIKKASGEGGDQTVESTYEAYGPGGVAIYIEVATDNQTRTVANIRSYLNKYGGSLGKDGCLQFVFERKGIFTLDRGSLDEEEFTLQMIDAGASDVEFSDEEVLISCDVQEFGQLTKILATLNIEPKESGLIREPVTFSNIEVSIFEKFNKLLNLLEEDDDVMKVYHNVEYSEELASLMG